MLLNVSIHFFWILVFFLHSIKVINTTLHPVAHIFFMLLVLRYLHVYIYTRIWIHTKATFWILSTEWPKMLHQKINCKIFKSSQQKLTKLIFRLKCSRFSCQALDIYLRVLKLLEERGLEWLSNFKRCHETVEREKKWFSASLSKALTHNYLICIGSSRKKNVIHIVNINSGQDEENRNTKKKIRKKKYWNGF